MRARILSQTKNLQVMKAERIGKNPAQERANTITIVHRSGPPGVVGTARRKGNQRNWGRPGMVAESRYANVARKGGGSSGRRKGSEVPMKPGNAGGGKDPYFW